MKINENISVICPFFNEQDIIAAALEIMVKNLNNHFNEWELILVNDGSSDKSLSIVTEEAKKHGSRVRILSYKRNQGRGRAIKSGIDLANGDIVVTTEIDCSWGDTVICELVDKLVSDNLHAVVASPHCQGGGMVNVPFHRRVLSRFGNKVINTFFKSGVTMNTGMTRAYRREVIQPLIIKENGKEFHLEVLLKLNALNLHLGEIPATLSWIDKNLSRTNRLNNRKSSTKIFKTIFSHIDFLSVAQPRNSFTVLAMICFIGGIGFLIWATIQLLKGQVSAFFAIVGLQLLLFALIFLGFSVVFFQLRELLSENWLRYYKNNIPPNLDKVEEVSKSSSEKDSNQNV
tara:strand:- start:31 stop:1065 length:1035 start_codon:yes stop_codon:yes gene_type:complete